MKTLKGQYIHLTPESRLSKLPVPIIGLTGGIATGKTTVSNYIRAQGYPLICADQMVKQIYQSKETQSFISGQFPQAISNGLIDFKKLRDVFFHSDEAQKQIEAYIYPRLSLEFQEEYKKLGNPSYVFYDVPLLFEKNMDSGVDIKILVYAPFELQLKRLLERDKNSEELAKQILSKQWPIDKKKSLSDFIIKNEGAREELPREIENILNQIFI